MATDENGDLTMRTMMEWRAVEKCAGSRKGGGSSLMYLDR